MANPCVQAIQQDMKVIREQIAYQRQCIAQVKSYNGDKGEIEWHQAEIESMQRELDSIHGSQDE